MSLKVFNGYKFKKNISFLEVNNHIKSIRNEIEKEYKKVFFKKLYDMIIDFKDKQKILSTDDFKSYLENNYDIDINLKEIYPYLELNNKAKNTEDLFFDYSCSIVLYPTEDNILLQLFTTNSEFINLFPSRSNKGNIIQGKFDFLEEYEYFNNTDKPNYLSDEEWNKRELEWNKVFEKSGIPRYAGIIYEIIDKNNILEQYEIPKKEFSNKFLFEKLLKNNFIVDLLDKDLLPNKEIFESFKISFEDRVKNQAKIIVNKELFDDIYKKYEKEKFKFSNVLDTQEEVNNILKSEKGKKILKRKEKELEKLLDKNLEVEVFESIKL